MSDTYGVYVGDKLTEECVAICVTPERTRFTVRLYQEKHRGKVPIRVDRVPRAQGPVSDCGYCHRAHVGFCRVDRYGEPSPITEDATA